MSQQSPVLLAVDPGTREIGFAVISNRELIRYGVKTVRVRTSPRLVLETVTAFIKELFETFEPRVLAIEKMFVTQKNSALLAVVAEQIKALAREQKMQIYDYAPSSIRKRLCQSGKATKREVAKLIAASYPELARYYAKTRRWELDYYSNLFDAVAVGLVCLEELKQTAHQLKN